MTSQTLSPDTGEMRRIRVPNVVANGYGAPEMQRREVDAMRRDEPTQRLYPPPSPLPRPEADTAVLNLPPRTAVFLGEGFEPDTNPPQPIPYPAPAGPHPRRDKVLVPLLRPAAPLGEYAEKRSVLYVRPAGAGGPGRHRRPSLLARLLGGVATKREGDR